MSVKNIKLWGWDKKPRTMLRYIKVGDIICYESNDNDSLSFRYGQIIAKLTSGHVFRGFDVQHQNPDDITAGEITTAKQYGKIFVLDVYTTLDKKKYLKNGEWRVIGRENNFKLNSNEIKKVFFSFGVKGMKYRVDLLDNTVPISDVEAENYISSGPVTGDQAKIWYLN